MKFDPIRVIEMAYDGDDDDERWLHSILDTLTPLDRGMGLAAATFQLNEGHLVHRAYAGRDMAATWLARRARFWEEEAAPPLVRAYFPPNVPVVTVRQLSRKIPKPLIEKANSAPEGVSMACDALGVLAIDYDGRGTFVSVPSKCEVRVSPRTRQQLACVSAHLVSARRLRSLAAFPGEGNGAVEVVLDAAGRVHHAVAGGKPARARTHLAEAVRRVERARGRLRRTDPDEALALWSGLIDGHWSLVDHCERDGRRFILARRNEPGVRDPKALTSRERDVVAYALLGHSNKYIGYMLGIAPSTISSHLESAMKKLQVRSRRELLASFSTFCATVNTDRR
jgi:DNA-binding CsgD family transcriptional regulator